jgi:hypothetical protein
MPLKQGSRNRKLDISNRKSKIGNLPMYRRPKFLEVLHAIREEMSREADYDVDLFAELVRSGIRPAYGPERRIRGFKSRAPRAEDSSGQGRKIKEGNRK